MSRDDRLTVHLEEARALRRAIGRLQRSLRNTRDLDAPTPSQLSALGTLYRDGPLATGELAERERLKPQSVTRLVAALTDRGFIRRAVDATDRRRFVVAITPAGTRRLAREMERRDEQLARELAHLGSEERATLRAACDIIELLGDRTNSG